MPEGTFTPQPNTPPKIQPSPQPGIQEKPTAPFVRKNFFGIAVAALIILIISVSVWFVIQLPSLNFTTEETLTQFNTTFGSQKTTKVDSVEDLEKLEKEVKSTNIDNLTKDLDKNDADATEF